MPPPRPKVPPYLMMLVVSFALVGLIGYQTLKDRKTSGDLLLENRRLKEDFKEEKKKANNIQKEFTKLLNQKEQLNSHREGLNGQLIELGREKRLCETGKKQLESSLAEKENEIKHLKTKLAILDEREDHVKLLEKEVALKVTEISELKAQMKIGGKYSEPTDTSENVVKDEEKPEKSETRKEDVTSSENGIAVTVREISESDEETNNTKTGVTKSKEHTEEQTEVLSEKKKKTQVMDVEDEELKVDDRGETEMDEEADADKSHDDEEVDKTHEEEETDEQADVDMDVVSKADIDENEEIAAME